MARTKQPVPIRREASSEYTSKMDRIPQGKQGGENGANGHANGSAKAGASKKSSSELRKDVINLVIAVGGVWGAFIYWGYLQEKLTKTVHQGPDGPEKWKFAVFLLTIQSTFAFLTGGVYHFVECWSKGQAVTPILRREMLGPLLLISFTNALAAPFGYAALAHIDYITYILAKSCKLLPVMFLRVTLFRQRYPLYKYLVVAAVTAGVAVFTLHSGKKHKPSKSSVEGNYAWGLLLLGVNLLFDGLTNSTQDYIFATFRPFTGSQMMCATNLLSTIITLSYLLMSPWLVHTGVGEWFGMDVAGSAGELTSALAFMGRHPAVWWDVLAFCAAGAIGQVFIFFTLSTFSSVLLVTVTVTRKMFSMIISVLAFGHRLTGMQWVGVGLVFGGIGVEAAIARQEKMAKEEAKRRAALEGKKDS